MSKRDGYEPGIPCWLDHSSPDPEAAARFYGELLGWKSKNHMPRNAPGQYFMAKLRGRDVAAMGSRQTDAAPPMWNTYVAVESADETAAKIRDAGGTVVDEPFDAGYAGRMAVARDPEGASFCLWQAGRHPGAGLVNEPGALCWNEVTARDADAAKDFYGEVFGWRSSVMDPQTGYTLWHPPGDGDPAGEDPIGGMMPLTDEAPSEQPAAWGICFSVQDTDAIAAKAGELGGGTLMDPFDTPVGRTAVLSDPQGAMFAVIVLANAGG